MANTSRPPVLRLTDEVNKAEPRLEDLKRKAEAAADTAEARLADVTARRMELAEGERQAEAAADQAKQHWSDAKNELSALQMTAGEADNSAAALRSLYAELARAAEQASQQIPAMEKRLDRAEAASDVADTKALAAAREHRAALHAYQSAASTLIKSKQMPSTPVGQAACTSEPFEPAGDLNPTKLVSNVAFADAQRLKLEMRKLQSALKNAMLEAGEKQRAVFPAFKSAEEALQSVAAAKDELKRLSELRDAVCAAAERARKASEELQTVNIVEPHIKVTATDTEQFVEVWYTDKRASHAFTKGGDLTCDSSKVSLLRGTDAFDGKATNGELRKKQKFPFQAAGAGVFNFTLSLEDPADSLCLVENNPVTDKAILLTIHVIDEKTTDAIKDIRIAATLEGEVKLKSADTPIRRWMKDASGSRINELAFTDPEDFTWAFVSMSS